MLHHFSLTRFFHDFGVAPELEQQALQAANGVLHPADAETPIASDAYIRTAIALAAGGPVHGMRRIPITDFGDEVAIAYDETAPFGRSMAVRLDDRRRSGLHNRARRLGRGSWPQLRDRLVAALLVDVASPLGIRYREDPDDGPFSAVGENLVSPLFYLFMAAAVGDGEGVASLAPLVRLSPVAVPVAEFAGRPGTWLVADVPLRTQ